MTAPHLLPDLTSLPSAAGLYARAALTARRKGAADRDIPGNAVTLRGLRFDAAHRAAYNALCQLPADALAITYPQVLAAPLHIHALIQPNYPFPLLGMVHVSNRIAQHAALSADAAYDVQVRVGASRRVAQGLEVDLHTEFLQGSETPWSATTTVLHRLKAREAARKPAPPLPPAQAARYTPFDVPADIGRRYAPIAGDYNPIHLYAITARPLGFSRAIAHGMWSLARCLGVLLPDYGGAPTQLDVKFKQPLLLPGRVTLKHLAGDDGTAFDLLAREGGKLHLSGRLGGRL